MRGVRRMRSTPACAAVVMSARCSLVRLASSTPLRLALPLDRVEIGCVRRQPLDNQPAPLGSQPGLHAGRAVRRQAIPAQGGLLPGEQRRSSVSATMKLSVS
jgi:hypothetical protein